MIAQGQSVTVSYTDPSAGDDDAAIQDTLGNDAASFTTGEDGVPAVVNGSIVDRSPPTLTEASVGSSGDEVSLGFDEDLDGANPPAAGDFAVTADGASVAVASVSVGGRVVELSGLSPVIGPGQEVVVSYADPSVGDDANALQDVLGHDAASTSPPARTACPPSSTSPPSTLSGRR